MQNVIIFFLVLIHGENKKALTWMRYSETRYYLRISGREKAIITTLYCLEYVVLANNYLN